MYSGLAVAGEVGYDDAKVYRILFLLVLHLPHAIWLSLLFAGLGVFL